MALILVIDDSRIVHVALSSAFQRDGHDTIGLSSISKLGQTLERERPDVIVLDLLMPGVSGVELARLIEQTSEAPPPIILHSGSSPEIASIVAREIRPFEIVPKGDSERRLRDAVNRALVTERRPPSTAPRRPSITRDLSSK